MRLETIAEKRERERREHQRRTEPERRRQFWEQKEACALDSIYPNRYH
jgi:hypothetical protein